METSELVFSVIDTMSTPVLLLNDEAGEWVYSYFNEAMNKLLKNDEAGEISQDMTVIDSSLLTLLKLYEEAASDTYTLHDVDSFDSVYNINFNKNKNHLLINFIEIKPIELFDNISFNDFSGACNAIVVVLDIKGDIVDVNECFSNIVGIKKDALLSKSFFENFIPGDIKILKQYFGEILKKEAYDKHFVAPLKGEKEEVYRINWQVSKMLKHNQTYVIAVGCDISKFIEENSELKKQLTSIKVGFEYFPLAVAYMGAGGIFTKMNSRFMKMFRISESDSKVSFDKVALFKKHIGFDKMNENIKLIKELSYKIELMKNDKAEKIKVDIRLLSGKKESSKLYIVVAQKVT